MTSINWLTTIPVARAGSIKEGRASAYVDDSSNEVGKSRRRKRYTRTRRTFEFALSLSAAEKALLDTFIDTTTDGGVLTFNWTHPVTATVYEVQFASLPSFDDDDTVLWQTKIMLEEV